MSDYAIVAEDLTYHYGQLTAVDSISFRVTAGEILGFLGPNGAGKTTTVRMLTGQRRPHAGHALLLGLDVTQHPKEVQAQIGVSFETTNLYEQMNATENLELFARLFGVADFSAESLLRRVGLDGRGRQRVEGFSKGMKQRLMVARALVNRPRILFLDEPTEGLDPTSSRAIQDLILEERERGATVFLTTHDMVEADKLCDRVAFINQGEIVALDTPRALKQQYGQRLLRVEVADPNGRLDIHEIDLDSPDTGQAVAELFSRRDVVTIHSEEATLEDIFIELTGQRLV